MLVAILFALRPMVGDLTHGNINLFILFLVVAGLYAYYRQRDVSAGVLLALSPLNEHGSMKARAMIAACVIAGVVIFGARVWTTWVHGLTPGATATAGF